MMSQVAKLNIEKKSYFHCAKEYEVASQIYRELKDYAKVAECVETGVRLLRESNIVDSASILCSKGAR